ncbi:MAG: hypothetical protein V2J26_02060 [Pacificimonas sp.]|nr:hypothetical protein [Pacificimonas sp.]
MLLIAGPIVAALLSVASTPALAETDGAAADGYPVAINFVDNFTARFAVPPDFLWAELKRMYVDGNKYRDLGFAVELIEPSATSWLGGSVVTSTAGGVLDRREAHLTSLDDELQFMAIRVVYSDGSAISVSYDVRPAGEGSLMQLIVHARQTVPVAAADGAAGEPPSAADVRAAAEALSAYHYGQLEEVWAADIARIEALYAETR